MKKTLKTLLSLKKNNPKDLYERLLKEIKKIDQYIDASSKIPERV